MPCGTTSTTCRRTGVVLWGHHFTAVAGAAPIIGPSIAVVWGWLPAFLWVVIGTMFFAGVHDFGAIWASVRNKALSVGSLTGEVVSHRARNLFMIVVFFLLLMVNAVFAVAIANEFINTPASVIPAWTAVFVAVGIGILLYKVGVGITWPTVVGTIILYAVIYLGEIFPVTLAETAGIAPAAQWILILFAYAAVASMLPGLAAAAAARLHQRHPALRRPRHPVRRGLHRRPDDSRAADQSQRPAGDAADHAAAVRHHRLRRDLRLPWPGQLRHHVEAAQHGDRRALRRLSRIAG